MKRKLLQRSDAAYTVLFWLVLLLVLVIAVYLNNRCQPLPIFQGTVTYDEDGWRFGEKGKELRPAVLSDKYVLEPGIVYVLTTDLSYDGSHDSFPSAFFSVGNLEVEVYLHGIPVFRHSHAEKIFKQVQSVGGSCVTVSLGKDCAGKNLRVELRNPMDHPVTARLPGVTFGDHETQMRRAFLRCLPSMLLSCAITFAVLILVLLGNTVDGTQWTYVYFSLFAMLIVLYRAMHDLFVLYIWAKPFMAVLCEYFSIVASPIPLLMSYRYRLKPHYQVEFNTLVGASILILALETVLHFTGIRDVIDMMVITHVWILMVSAAMILLGLGVKKKTGEKFLLRKLLPILIGMGLELIHFYLHKYVINNMEHYSTGDFIGVGLLISLALMIWEARKARIDAARAAERNAILEKVAYTDVLTGISNRAAFTKDVAKISDSKPGGRQLLMVSADLNGLKQTNDSLGHIAGDMLIRRAADLLRDCLSPWGEVYRTGGDEFFALLQGISEDQWNLVGDKIKVEITRRNQGESVPLSIALGVADIQEGNVNAAISLADRRMYADKERQHEAMKNI